MIDFRLDVWGSDMENLDKNYDRESQDRQIKLRELEEISIPELR